MSETQTLMYDGVQHKLHTHPDLIRGIIQNSNTFFEEWLLTPLKTKVSSFDFVLDIGSNIGNHAYFFKNICNANRVVCFEPLKGNLDMLRLNCPNCEIVDVAISSTEGVGYLEHPDGYNNNSGTARLGAQGQSTQLKTLDSFGFTNVTFIKIDVEGHELEVLKGAQHTINESKPDMLIEIHTGIEIEDVSNLLPSGYVWEKIAWESHYLFTFKG